MAQGKLSKFEIELAKKLYSDKYATYDWNLCGRSILS
jgi:hypothetical protein